MSSAYNDPQSFAPVRHSSKTAVCAKVSRNARLLASAAFLSIATASAGYAQDVREDDKTDRVAVSEQSSQGATVLEIITIEARRYGENPIDVPVSVSVIDEEKIQEERLNEIQDIANKTVGLQMPNYGDDPRTVQPIVRGVGTLSSLLSPDNSTAPTIVDGVPMPAFASNGQLLDVGQVEVLRGPQGTLYGRNSTGGAINVFSVTPTDETIRQVTGEIGTEGYRKGELLLGGAINEELMGRFSMRYLSRGAYVTNDHPGQDDIGGFDLGAVKGSFLMTPGDATEVKFTLGHERYVGDTGYPYLLRDGNAWQETPEFQRSLTYATLNVSHEFENFALKTTTGFTQYDIYNWTDNSDGYINSPTSIFFGPFRPVASYTYDGDVNVTDQRENQYYQEVRLQSLDGADTKWVVGGVFSYNDFNENVFGTSSMSASINGTRDVNLTSTSSALFFDIAQPLGEKFEIGGGMRYTHERKGIDALFTGIGLPGTVASFAQDSSRNFDMLSGRVSLSYKVTEDSLVYGSVSRGTRELSAVFVELPCTYMARVFGELCPKGLKPLIENDPAEREYREITSCASIQSVLHQMSVAPVGLSLRSLFLTSKTYELIALGLERLSIENCDCRLTPADVERLKRARDILSENLSDPPSLIALAHEVGINDFKLKKGFKTLFDNTPFGYLKERRMIAARTALMKGEQSVTTVANQVGYTNLGHFAAAFRKQFGTTPKAMKKMSQLNINILA